MFKRMKGLDTAFRYVRGFSVVVLLSCCSLTAVVLYQRHAEIMAGQGRVFVLANGKALEAFVSSRKDNIVVEARDHILTFHEDFFTLDPDEKTIQTNITKALYLADESAKKQYDNLREAGFYSDIIAGNISQRIAVDSIVVNDSRIPISFRFYGKEKIIRTTRTVMRSLITEGDLREVERSDHNSHGFLISHWNIVENNDLSPVKQ